MVLSVPLNMINISLYKKIRKRIQFLVLFHLPWLLFIIYVPKIYTHIYECIPVSLEKINMFINLSFSISNLKYYALLYKLCLSDILKSLGIQIPRSRKPTQLQSNSRVMDLFPIWKYVG